MNINREMVGVGLALTSIDEWNRLPKSGKQKWKNVANVHHLELGIGGLVLNRVLKINGLDGFSATLIADDIEDLPIVLDKWAGYVNKAIDTIGDLWGRFKNWLAK